MSTNIFALFSHCCTQANLIMILETFSYLGYIYKRMEWNLILNQIGMNLLTEFSEISKC